MPQTFGGPRTPFPGLLGLARFYSRSPARLRRLFVRLGRGGLRMAGSPIPAPEFHINGGGRACHAAPFRNDPVGLPILAVVLGSYNFSGALRLHRRRERGGMLSRFQRLQIVLFAGALPSLACGAVGKSSFVPRARPADGEAVVYLYRPLRFVGFALASPPVLIDRRLVSRVPRGRFLELRMKVGTALFAAGGDIRTITLKSGIYYLRADYRTAWNAWEASLEWVEESRAREELRECEPGGEIHTVVELEEAR